MVKKKNGRDTEAKIIKQKMKEKEKHNKNFSFA